MSCYFHMRRKRKAAETVKALNVEPVIKEAVKDKTAHTVKDDRKKGKVKKDGD